MSAVARTPEAQALLERWRTEKSQVVLQELFDLGIFPSEEQETWEREGGVYPDLIDPLFLPKLMRKREFQESKQPSLREQKEELDKEGKEKCRSVEDFELTSTQKFVARILSPRTPYNSALLYHGVGVGKTCAAVTVCESYLDAFPGRKVFIVAPPNIQDGFRRTIFDFQDGLKMGEKDSGLTSNHHRGCTGDLYLHLTKTMNETNRSVIETKITKAIKSRYEFFGYTSFYNYIRQIILNIPVKAGHADYERLKRNALRDEFSNRVLIIDEAHNLRDNPLESEAESADDAQPADSMESKAGKRLTPYLREVLDVAEGVTLLLMTATPMYNSYMEIIFLLNLLLLNDKLPRLRPDDIFDMKKEGFTEDGARILGRIASQYISFMRGENPLTFPIRLDPISPQRLTVWPRESPKGEPITDAVERAALQSLPILGCSFSPESEQLYKSYSRDILQSAEGLGITNMDLLVQAGNWIFPGEEGDDFLDRVRQQGFDNTFSKEKRGNLISYKNQNEERGASWLREDALPAASGKCYSLLQRLKTCRGVGFIYSRFVGSGALTIALALEANGYTPWNREIGLLAEGNQHPDGRQCALCKDHERTHSGKDHSFKAAKYVLLTGSEELSPNNAKAIEAARSRKNMRGEEIKVVIGSQIAGEGLDLRFIREIFVFDSWYHLNKLEQIVGRGIRNCSHADLDTKERNCTVSLLVNKFLQEPGAERESVDMYSYRLALKKARVVGIVNRVLKEYAMDCSLNKDAILVKNMDPIPLVLDSQGNERENYPINDVPFTPLCDYLETCEYECKSGMGEPMPDVLPIEEQDVGTYDEYTAKVYMNKIRLAIQEKIVKGSPFVKFEMLEKEFRTIPRPLLANLLQDITQQSDTKIKTPYGEGRILFRNGYYVFQPDAIADTKIPIALRTLEVPVAKDHYEPREIVVAPAAPVEGSEDVGTEDSEGLWEAVKEWAKAIEGGSASDESIPVNVEEEVGKLRESQGVMKAQKERLEMILWLYKSVKENVQARATLAVVVLEYIWDEFLTFGTKKELLLTQWTDPQILKTAKDSYWELEGVLYVRLVNPETNTMVYICVDAAAGTAAECPKAIVEVLEREKERDPLLSRPLDARYTGYEYGFLNFNPKKKKIVFKKGKPPMPKGKLGRGSECSINSSTSHELQMLERHGQSLKGAGGTDLGLNAAELGIRRIQNSVRICTVSNLALRFMDQVRVQGKRWFYREVESNLLGHPLR